MTKDQERQLAAAAHVLLPYLEERKAAAVNGILGDYRSKADLRDKAAELSVLSDLISGLKAKQENYNKE